MNKGTQSGAKRKIGQREHQQGFFRTEGTSIRAPWDREGGFGARKARTPCFLPFRKGNENVYAGLTRLCTTEGGLADLIASRIPPGLIQVLVMLGASWGALGGETVLELFWRRPGSVLEAPWGVLWASWRRLGPSWKHLEAS